MITKPSTKINGKSQRTVSPYPWEAWIEKAHQKERQNDVFGAFFALQKALQLVDESIQDNGRKGKMERNKECLAWRERINKKMMDYSETNLQ